MSDKIIRMLAYDGKISITCIDSTELVENARKMSVTIHGSILK